MDRRSFLMAAGSTCILPRTGAFGADLPHADVGRTRLESFDYRGVRLLESRFQKQVLRTRELYFNMSNDDMLKGFRQQAGLPAPGKSMKGWCVRDCGMTFGQWISGMARLSCATDDAALREKAITPPLWILIGICCI